MCSEKAVHKHLESFQKYFRVDVNHVWQAVALKCGANTAQKMKFFIKDFFGKCDLQIGHIY